MSRARGELLALLLLTAGCSMLLAAFALAAPKRPAAPARHSAKGHRCMAHPRSAHHAARRCRHSHHTTSKAPTGTSKPGVPPTPGATPTGGTASPPPSTGTVEPPAAGGGPPVVPRVQVTAVEYSYTLSRTTVPAGKVILEFVNKGQDEHNLNALGDEGEFAGSFANEVSNGVTHQTLVLKPGSYTLFCSLPEHEQKGMKATLLVQ